MVAMERGPPRRDPNSAMGLAALILAALALAAATGGVSAEHTQSFRVKEDIPVGTVIGTVGGGEDASSSPTPPPPPPYLIVPVGSAPDRDLIVNSQTGEIRTKRPLDRETTASYALNAIPLSGDSIRVMVEVADINDNTPTFPESEVDVDIPENTPRGTKRKLARADDADTGEFGAQEYDIISGNDGDAFLLSYDGRELDLVVNADLDRERVDTYRLKIVALDGGTPPRTGTLTVNVNVQDLNDNPPLFGKQRYFTSVPEDLPPGSSVLRVSADDADSGRNARVTYSINRRQSDRDGVFRIDASTGLLVLDKRLDYDRKQVHEIVVVARDGGEVPQETSAFITVRLTDAAWGAAGGEFTTTRRPSTAAAATRQLKMVYFSRKNSVPEDLPVGRPFAKLVLTDAAIVDENVVDFKLVQQGRRVFKLFKNSTAAYLTVARELDFEKEPRYEVTVEVNDPTNSLNSFKENFEIVVGDSNDHAPKFERATYKASLEESSEPGTSVLAVRATDKDDGENGRLRYSLRYDEVSSVAADWFSVDGETGLISTRSYLDCEAESNPRVIVVAEDGGDPRQTATATLSVSVTDVNDNVPLFESAFYEARLPEDKSVGDCFLKVEATDLDCGLNSVVHYSIKESGSVAADAFSVERDTGRICITRGLDHERQSSYDFTVVAADRGGLSTSTMVKVEVADVNDNEPEFKPDEYRAKIRSRFPVGGEIVTVMARDADSGPAGDVRYRIVGSGPASDQFSIDPESGTLSLRSPLSTTSRFFEVYVGASDGEGHRSRGEARVVIEVDDDDLTFNMPQYNFAVDEDVSPYSDIGRVEAKTTPDGELEIYSSNVDNYVSIDPRTGLLRTEARLDHESNPTVILNVKMQDSSTGLESYCQIVLEIKDQNDNAPEFGHPVSMATVPEDFRVGEVIYVVKAQDADSGLNGQVSYRLLQNPGSLFRLDGITGEVFLEQPLDYERSKEHIVTVEATDKGYPPLKSVLKLHVFVHDINDNAPAFDKSEFNFHLQESHSTNTPIATVKATDADGGRNGKVTYNVSDNPYVSVLQNSGVLVLKRPLDREAKRSVEVTVTASDHGIPPRTSTASVRLTVSDQNDNSPRFEREQYSFSTVENLPHGTFVGSVTAVDEDDGDNGRVEYDFKIPVDSFVIDRSSGRISTGKVLDREEDSEHELLVEAVDLGRPRRSSQTLVKITVDDLNDNAPSIVEPASRAFYVKKGTPLGTVVGRIVAVDPDQGDARVSFKVLDSNPTVSVSPDGEVRLVRRISTSGGPGPNSIPVTIQLSDFGSPVMSAKEEIALVVVSEEDGHQLIPLSKRVMEASPDAEIGSVIGSVASGTGGDFYFTAETVGPIVVDKLTGDVIVAGKLLRDEYSFRVDVESQKGDVSPTTVDVKVELTRGLSGPPVYVEDPAVFSLKEDADLGSKLVSLNNLLASGSKSGRVSFEIVDQMPSPAFEIHSGNLVLGKSLDYERDSEYLVIVRGFSGSKYSSDITLLVNVIDVNDNAPKFLSGGKLTLPSDAAVNSAVFKFVVTDEDGGENGRVELSIAAGNSGETFKLHSDNRELILAKRPAYNSFSLQLRATDGGGKSVEQSLNINVASNGDDSTPRFEQSVYYANVAENLNADARVLDLHLNRRTSGGLVFELLKGEDNFRVDRDTGEVTTVASLDREKEESHALIVSVSHAVGASGIADTAIVYVTVDDVNDNAPKFGQSCRDIVIPENSNHSFVHAIVADDEDLGSNGRVSYSLDGTGDGKFRIERDTGRLFALPMDREEQERYELIVFAVDHGPERRTSKCEFTVRIADENDNDPTFTQSIYSASVREDIPKGTEVMRVVAADADVGQNAAITYSIEDDSSSAFAFSIDPNTGAIFNTATLDREATAEHRFEVFARDRGERGGLPGSGRAQVRIIVTDANDHQPEFSEFPFRINMTATPSAGIPLLRLYASDPDIGPNGQLAYNILRPEQREKFQLSPEEGLLTLATDVTWEPGKVETLEVAVSDAGSPPRSSTGLVEITIEGGPAVTLAFQERVYKASVRENPPSGHDLTQVRAVRSDGRRQRVIYTFLRGHESGAFEINSNNGLIRVRDPELIDFESSDGAHFNLTISARGLGGDGLAAYTTCVVSVEDVNDHAPKFSKDSYEAWVREAGPKGAVVVSAVAMDLDGGGGGEGEITYEIIDGNVDGAFVMSPAASSSSSVPTGTILTNTVLDREIKDEYELTVSATDSGVPPLVGLATVVVRVIDENDNRPHFAPIRPIKIDRDTRPGSVVAVLRANDIDLSPAVTYRLDRPSDYFSLDTYTGQLILLKGPGEADQEDVGQMTLSAVASDSVHEARTQVEVEFVEGGRDCRPEFSQPIYSFYASSNDSYPASVGAVQVAGCGGGGNGDDHTTSLAFEVARKEQGRFSVLSNGTVVLNRLPYGDADSFVLTATDQRSRKRATAVVVVAKGGEGSGAPQAVSFADSEDSISLLGRGQAKADPVARIRTNIDPPEGLFFSMTENPLLQIDSANGDVFRVDSRSGGGGPRAKEVTVTVRQLANWQQTKSKTFRIVGGAERGSLNEFTESKVSFTIKEDAPTKSTDVKICPVRVTSNVFIKIISGNGENIFSYDERRRVLILSKSLDFERRAEHQIVLKMGSSGGEFSLCKVKIVVEDVNDNAPMFPSCRKEFAVTVPENSPRGFSFSGPPAVDLDSGDGLLFWISNTRQFDVDADTGALTTRAVFDYEASVAHRLIVHANDSAGHESSCNVLVLVGSVDEYPPTFDQTNYYFSLPGLASGSPGDVVGQVRARDRDRGPDGVVTFELTEPSDYFAVDALRGVITVSKALDTGVLDEANVVRKRRKRSLRDVRLAVRAKSRQPDSLEATAVVAISVEENLLPVAVRDGGGGSAGWVAGVLVAILLVLIVIVIAAFFFCRKKIKKDQQRKFGGVGTSAAAGGGQVNAGMNASDSMELSSNGTVSSVTNLSRFPPQYSEIIADYDSRNPKQAKAHHQGLVGNSRSEISEKSHRSASSGRGSVEDCDEEVDSEIRMINEGGGCYLGAAAAGAGAVAASDLIDAPPDKSDTASVQNTEEYLARLGIDIRKPPNLASATGSHHGGGDMVHNFSAAAGGSHYGGGGSSIYNRIADDALSEKNSVMSAKHSASVLYGATGRMIGGGGGGGQPSMTGSLSSIVHSEEELAGSYNWDYLLDWGPQYQSLAHVFKEISRLKDDSVGGSVHRRGPGLSVSATAGASAPPSFPRGFPSPSSVPAPQSYGLAKNPHTSHLHHTHRSTRSPISQLDMGPSAGRGALSPNFHPSLSPLAATKSPSVSPMAVAMSGVGGGGGQLNKSGGIPPQRI